MTIILHHNDLTIEVFEDPEFSQASNCPSSYNKIIQPDQDKPFAPTSQHGIKVYQNNDRIMSAIILACGGGTGVLDDAALTDENNLIIRCCNKLFSLTLPELETNWMTEVDWATCFSVYKYQDTYITHGELSIARIDRTGKTLWSFSGADIFVCLYEGNPFEMNDTYISLTDFTGRKYKIDYNGKSIK